MFTYILFAFERNKGIDSMEVEMHERVIQWLKGTKQALQKH